MRRSRTTVSDAKALATLLRGDFVARVHVPSRDVPRRKNVVRQRLWLARIRTMIRNRIHCVIDRHPLLERPAVKDIFSNQRWLWGLGKRRKRPLFSFSRSLVHSTRNHAPSPHIVTPTFRLGPSPSLREEPLDVQAQVLGDPALSSEVEIVCLCAAVSRRHVRAERGQALGFGVKR